MAVTAKHGSGVALGKTLAPYSLGTRTRQHCVSLSTVESQYVGLSDAVRGWLFHAVRARGVGDDIAGDRTSTVTTSVHHFLSHLLKRQCHGGAAPARVRRHSDLHRLRLRRRQRVRHPPQRLQWSSTPPSPVMSAIVPADAVQCGAAALASSSSIWRRGRMRIDSSALEACCCCVRAAFLCQAGGAL